MNLIVTVKHYQVVKPATKINIEERVYDRDEEYIFTYDMHTLGIVGSAWKKEVKPEDVADTIKAFFTGNYVIADIQKQLD